MIGRRFLTGSLLLALVVYPALLTPSPKGQAQAASESRGNGLAGTGQGRDSLVSAIVTLSRKPVVEHEREIEATSKLRPGIDFMTGEAVSYESLLTTEQRDFERAAKALSPDVRVGRELRLLINAVSLEAPRAELMRIAELPGVTGIEPVTDYEATLDKSVPLIGAPNVWAQLGGASRAGAGVKIAILDSGIDITNPLFADAGFTAPAGFPRGASSFTNNKVIVAKAFLADATATPGDENGHGTHVAGIAAGDFGTNTPLGPISGVAPSAYLGNYRILDRNGAGKTDLVISGLEEVVRDGFDVANMSIGGPGSSELTTLDQAVENAVAAGVVLVIAAGNSGPNRLTISSPGEAPSAITVGASSNAHRVLSGVVVTGPEPISADLLKPALDVQGQGGSFQLSTQLGPFPYVDLAMTDPNIGCQGLPAGSLKGKVALIETTFVNTRKERKMAGGCPYVDKIMSAAAAGASGAIVFNNEFPGPGLDEIPNVSIPGTTIPTFFVLRTKGLALRQWLSQHADATLEFTPASEVAAPSDVLASFSSRGPSAPSGLKPDLVGPGMNVYSGMIRLVDSSGFFTQSGTSMACPHGAGSAALLKQLKPQWSPAQIKSALISSASDAVFTDANKTVKEGVLEAGGGRIDLARASGVSVTFSPASLSFGVNRIRKAGAMLGATLQVTNVSASQVDSPITVQQLDPGAGVTVAASVSSVSLARGATAAVTITVSAESGVERRDYTGFILMGGADGPPLRVPYWLKVK